MDERIKNPVSFVVMGAMLSATLPSAECGPKEICPLLRPEPPHTHQEEPGQPGNPVLRTVVTASASSSLGVYTLLSEMPRTTINWRKV